MKYFLSGLLLISSYIFVGQQDGVIFINEEGKKTTNDTITTLNQYDFTQYLTQLKNESIQQGYFEFSIDSIADHTGIKKVFFTQGKKYYPGKMVVQSPLLDSVNALSTINSQQLRSFEDWTELMDPLNNNGYPFAEIRIADMEMEDTICNLFVEIIPNQLVLIDSIIIKSEYKIENRLIGKLAGIKKGERYNEEKIKNLKNEMDKNQFYTQTKSPEVLFTNDGAHLYFYLKKKASNLLDGVVGLQQNSGDQKLSFTGALTFQLDNNFQRGEALFFDWKKLPSQTQELTSALAYPYIGFTNIGIKGSLAIFRQDSTFISTTKKAGLSYRISLYEEIGVFVENRNSFDQVNNETNNNNSSIYRAAGATYSKSTFDSAINPKQGYAFSLAYSIGNREEKSDQTTVTVQHKSEAKLIKPIPIYKGINLLVIFQEKFQTLGGQFQNEMIRFGGNKTLRGFDELSIEATSMAVASLNLRYFIDNNTHFVLFYDQSWYEKNGREEYLNDQPYGLGTGFGFSTNSGIFNFSYALGSQFNNPLDFRTGKIHFGFTSQF